MPRVKQVAFFPNHRQANPYLDLLEAGLQEVGMAVYPTDVFHPFRWWLAQHRGEIDVLHFHWLHVLYKTRRYVWSLAHALLFGAQLLYAKRLGYRIVWTLHNLYPHERPYPHLDYWVRRLVMRLADALIVHCGAARSAFEEEFGGHPQIYQAPLGNYLGVYADEVSRAEARGQFGIPDDRVVFVHLGGIRAYKGLDQLIRSFESIPDANVGLLIAGGVRKGYSFAEDVRQVLERDSRIITRLEWVPASEVQLYFRAADVVVCPFTSILTSSSVMLGMSFGLPVVAPVLGCLPEMVSNDMGLLYDPDHEHGLRNALIQCTEADLVSMGRRALQVAASFTWLDSARQVKRAYTGEP
jgi:glycosyltransferase involved in cell wall biosynthesis